MEIKIIRTFSMPPETHDKLRKLAKIYGPNMSAVVCKLIEREYAIVAMVETKKVETKKEEEDV